MEGCCGGCAEQAAPCSISRGRDCLFLWVLIALHPLLAFNGCHSEACIDNGRGRSYMGCPKAQQRWPKTQPIPPQPSLSAFSQRRGGSIPASELRFPPGAVRRWYLEALHLHGLEVQLALQVTDPGFLSADNGALGRALLHARCSRLRCLQLGAQAASAPPALTRSLPTAPPVLHIRPGVLMAPELTDGAL